MSWVSTSGHVAPRVYCWSKSHRKAGTSTWVSTLCSETVDVKNQFRATGVLAIFRKKWIWETFSYLIRKTKPAMAGWQAHVPEYVSTSSNRPWLPRGKPGSHRLTWTKVSNISRCLTNTWSTFRKLPKRKGLAVIASPVHLTIARYPRQHSKVTVTELRCTLLQCEYSLQVGHKRKLLDQIIRFNCIFREIQNVLQTMLRESVQ